MIKVIKNIFICYSKLNILLKKQTLYKILLKALYDKKGYPLVILYNIINCYITYILECLYLQTILFNCIQNYLR